MADTNMVMITQEAAKGLDSLPFLKTFAAEAFFFTAAVLMLLIHVGFMAYEGGVLALQESARDDAEEHDDRIHRRSFVLLLRLVGL